jgi:hypothetical protein
MKLDEMLYESYFRLGIEVCEVPWYISAKQLPPVCVGKNAKSNK